MKARAVINEDGLKGKELFDVIKSGCYGKAFVKKLMWRDWWLIMGSLAREGKCRYFYELHDYTSHEDNPFIILDITDGLSAVTIIADVDADGGFVNPQIIIDGKLTESTTLREAVQLPDNYNDFANSLFSRLFNPLNKVRFGLRDSISDIRENGESLPQSETWNYHGKKEEDIFLTRLGEDIDNKYKMLFVDGEGEYIDFEIYAHSMKHFRNDFRVSFRKMSGLKSLCIDEMRLRVMYSLRSSRDMFLEGDMGVIDTVMGMMSRGIIEKELMAIYPNLKRHYEVAYKEYKSLVKFDNAYVDYDD